jgi:hypothetical protein
VCEPVLDVSSWPLPPSAPFESTQDGIAGPPAHGEHEKLVATGCPTAYVPPAAGEEIEADGAPAATTVSAINPPHVALAGLLFESPP